MYNDLTVLIPTLNEEEAIGKVLDEVLEVGVPTENILVVDGGSRDRTVEIVRSKNIRVVKQYGRGKADAIKTGLEYIETPYVLIMDGDYTYPAEHIPMLYREIKKGYDLVIGARAQMDSQPLLYRLGNKLLSKTFNLLFSTSLRDVLSGMYIIRTDVLKEIGFEMKHFSVESEIVAHVASMGGKVREIPIKYRSRLGEKKLRMKHGLSIFRDMIRLTWRYNPAFLIFSLSSLLLIIGLLLGAWVAYYYFFYNIKYYIKGLIAILMTLTGLQALIAAITTLYSKRAEIRIYRKISEIARMMNYRKEEKK